MSITFFLNACPSAEAKLCSVSRPLNDDENLPNQKMKKKKTKAPKKEGIQGTKWKDLGPRTQMKHLRKPNTRGTSIKFMNSLPPVARNISNKKKRRTLT
jgi:hypothetical protein